MKIITNTEKTINLSDSFLDLNKRLGDNLKKMYNERSENLAEQIKILSVSESSNKKPNELGLSGKSLEAPQLLGNKTKREQNKINNPSIGKINEENKVKKELNSITFDEKEDNLLLNKFKPSSDVLKEKSKDYKIQEFTSKFKTNFYLFLNKVGEDERKNNGNPKKDILEENLNNKDLDLNEKFEVKYTNLEENINEFEMKKEENSEDENMEIPDII